MTTLLLKTKLHIPPVRPGLVPRPRLTELLNAGLHRKLTLVSAPAGYGKTTLVSNWLSGVGGPSTWLSLDENDNDPARFLTYLLAALQRVDADIGQATQAMVQAPQLPSAEALFTNLINDIAATSTPFVLVLDDYHLIHTLPIHQQLVFLLEHQPPQLHLVIATREEPPLPLSRLRARGQMVDVRQADLRFTMEETTDFLRRVMQLELFSADLTTLHRRTEGWIAGLQLAALSLQGSEDVGGFVRSFAGSHRYILDYLMDEVFRGQPADVREFLLRTSILDRFNASLCDAVSERDDSRQVLGTLEQANLFLVPLDESRQWYRYHRLFADLLRHRLEVEAQHQITRLHRQASRWYADHGFPADAVRHALAASDWEKAASFILSVSEDMLKRGEVVTLLGWFQALPEAVVVADPKVCLEYSWPLILSEQIDAAELYLTRAEQAALEHEMMPFLGAIATAKAYIARVRGDSARVIELSEQALSLLPQDDLSGRNIVAVNLGMTQWFRGRLAEAEGALLEAQRAGRESGNEYARWAASAFLNKIQAARGRLRQAAESCRQVIQQESKSPLTCLAHYDLGRLLYEWNHLEAAADHLQQGIELARRNGSVEFEFGGYSTLALIEQAQGETSMARPVLQRADRLLEHPDIPPPTRMYHLASQVTVALGQGDLDTASRLVERFPTGPEEAGSFPDYLLLMLARARLLLAQGRRDAAAEQLAALHGLASQAGWQSTAIQARALQALAVPTPGEALVCLTEALTLAEPEGYVRTFVDPGEPMVALLREAASQGIAPTYVEKLLAAFRQLEVPAPSPAIAQPLLDQPLVEPLSDRELDVLRLLADGLTYKEIARALHLSINTVKTHVRNIYGKLGVRRRREATVRAKELGFIP
jgi:LuxR family maltose regulon positive regulatory protein